MVLLVKSMPISKYTENLFEVVARTTLSSLDSAVSLRPNRLANTQNNPNSASSNSRLIKDARSIDKPPIPSD